MKNSFAGRSRAEKTLLALLSVSLEGMPADLLFLSLDETQGKELALEPLLAAGLVVRTDYDGWWACHPAALHAACRWAAEEGLLADLDQAVRELLPRARDSYDHALRGIRMALYADRVLETLERLQRCTNRFPDRDPIHDVCAPSFDPEWLKQRPETIRALFLRPATARSIGRFEPLGRAWELLYELVREGSAGPTEQALFLDQLVLRGRAEEAAELWEDGVGQQAPHLGAWIDWARGDLESASAWLEAGPRQVPACELPWMAGVFSWLATNQLERAEACLAKCLEAGGPVEFPFRVLAEVLQARRTGPGGVVRRLVEAQHDPEIGFGLNRLFLGLGLYWLEADRARLMDADLETVLERARSAGYAWAAGQTERLLSRIRGRNTGPGLVDLFPADAGWELALEALEGLTAAQRETRKVHDGSRLAWFVDEFEPGLYHLLPVIQKPDEQRGFSRGRRVALTKVGSLDILTDQDRRACSFVTGRGDSTRLQLEALFELVGHPAVFWHDRPSVRIEIARGQPSVRIARHERGFRLEPHPELRLVTRSSLAIQKEGDARLCLYEITPAYRQLATILDDGVTLPEEAGHRIPELLERLAQLAPVHSDVQANPSLVQVEADPRPRARLRPSGEGLHIRIVARPFGAEGPAFAPGEGAETTIGLLGGEPRQARRDREEEERRARAVAGRCPALQALAPPRWETILPEVAVCLETLEQLEAVGEEVVLEWPQGQPFKLRKAPGFVKLRLGAGQDWLALDGELVVDEELVLTLRQLLARLKDETGRFVPLDKGRFLALTREFYQRLLRLQALTELRGQNLAVHSSAVLDVEDVVQGWPAQIDSAWERAATRLRAARDEPIEVPDDLAARLRDYQADGFRWLARLAMLGRGACLADEMGLGKTVQCLALILRRASLGPTLVVAPASVCLNWADEVERFAPRLRTATLPGDKDRVEKTGAFDLVISSYASLTRNSKLLRGTEWSTLVLDEAQAVKNYDSKRSRAARSLSAGFRVALTGTPMENRLEELWSLFAFLNPGVLGDRSRFRRVFADPIEAEADPVAAERLRNRIQPFLLRRTKAQVLEELPSLQEVVRRLELNPAELAVYESVRREALARDKLEVGRLLADLTRLRQACCHAGLVQPELAEVPSSKLEALRELLDELRGGRHRALVFSQFVSFLELAEQVLKEESVEYHVLTGATSRADRKAGIDAFQAGHGEVFLISLKAGGTGLNLTGADCVIHLDPWWNPAVEDQASSRAHRIGQTRPVTVYRLVARGTLEERILDLHRHKRALAETLLAESADAARLTVEDLLALLGDPAPAEEAAPDTGHTVEELLKRGRELLPEEAAQLTAHFRHQPGALQQMLRTAKGERLWTAAWVAGSLGDPACVDPLVSALEQEEDEIFARALARLGPPSLERLVEVAFGGASDRFVATQAVEALADMGRLRPDLADRVAQVALAAIRDPKSPPFIRSEAVCLLLDLDQRQAIENLHADWEAHRFDETIVRRSSLTRALIDPEHARRSPAPSQDWTDELLAPHRVRFRQLQFRLLESELAGGSDPGWRQRFQADLDSLCPDPGPVAPRPGRNQPCHCGSGRKYKKCCLRKDEEQRTDPLLKEMQTACWTGVGYAMLPSQQLQQLPRELVRRHVELLTARGSEVRRQLQDETDPYLLLAGFHRFLSLERFREASDLVLLIRSAEPHLAVNPEDLRHLPSFPRDPDRHPTESAYRLDLTLDQGLQALSWAFLGLAAADDLEFAIGSFEKVWTTEPWTGWTAVAIAEAALLGDEAEAARPYLLQALERLAAGPSVHPAAPEAPCTLEVVEGYLADVDETCEHHRRLKALWSEISARPLPQDYRQWEDHELDRRLHQLRYRAKCREIEGKEPRIRLLARYRAEREALDEHSAELLKGLLGHPSPPAPIVAAAAHARGILWVVPVSPALPAPREVALQLETLTSEVPGDLRGRAFWALRNTVSELGSPAARLVEAPWGDFLALHLRVEGGLPSDELLALAETALSEIEADPVPVVVTAESSELVALGAGCSLAVPAPEQVEPEEPHRPEEPEVPGKEELLRRVLQRMLRMSKVGAAHTDVHNFFRGVPRWRQGEMKTMLGLLVKDGYIRLKPTVTETHISLEPRELAKVKRFLEGGDPPPGRIRDFL